MTESTEGDHARCWWKELPKRIVLRTLFDWAIAGGAPHRRYLLRLGFRGDRIGRFYDVVDNGSLLVTPAVFGLMLLRKNSAYHRRTSFTSDVSRRRKI